MLNKLLRVVKAFNIFSSDERCVDSNNVGRISSDEWNKILLEHDPVDEIVTRVSNGQFSEWGRFVYNATAHVKSVLELGSGTGEISLQLALNGCNVTLLDKSIENLQFANKCASLLGLEVLTVQADALAPLPFTEDSFDFSWSSGLLEHFTARERQFILKEQARITRGGVLALVPNAACIAYRAGKAQQESDGVWPYGYEEPLLSMRDDFAAAGIDVTVETNVGARHALDFLPINHPLRKALGEWMNGKSEDALRECGQGYLLATMGKKKVRNGGQ